MQGAGVNTSRAVTLTVGTGSNTVNLRDHATPNSSGVAVTNRGKLADGTTVTLGSGVTIGQSGSAVGAQGVYVLVPESGNTATHSIVSAATIYSTSFGLLVDNRGAGNSAITNAGAITTTGGNAGLRILDWTGNRQANRTTNSTATVTNSGTVATSAANAHGVHVDAEGLGLYRVVHSGTIATSGAGGHGILVESRFHLGAAETDRIEVESSGDITLSGSAASGIVVDTRRPGGGSPMTSGHIRVVTTGGTIDPGTGNTVFGILVTHEVTGGTTAEIRNAATINSEGTGIAVDARSSGDVTITNSGAITAGGAGYNNPGILVVDWSHAPDAGAAVYGGDSRTAGTETSVTNSGTVSSRGHGIRVDAQGLGSFSVIHETGGTITATGENSHGVFVDANYLTGAAGADAVTVESSGAIAASGANGIGILIRNFAVDRMITAAERGLESGADIADSAAGGRISVTNRHSVAAKRYGVHVDTHSPGAISVTNSGALTVDGVNGAGNDFGTGIRVFDRGSGDLSVSSSADIDAAGHGIYAHQTGSAGGVTVMHDAGDIDAAGLTGVTAMIGTTAERTNPDDVRVDVTGGSVTASPTRGEVAVHASTWGTGSVAVNVGRGAALTSMNNVGVFAFLEDDTGDGDGRISVSQGGRISAKGGVYALAAPGGVSETSRADARRPLIDVTWTGTFAPVERGDGVPSAKGVSHALALGHEAAARAILPRFDERAGIFAEAMSWRTASYHVATADRRVIEDADDADIILSADEAADPEEYALRNAILAEIGEALESDAWTVPGVDTDAIDTDGTAGLSADEIATWLGTQDDRHTIMTNALGYALSDEEAAVLRALAEGGDLTAALDALETAVGGTLPDNYRTRVTALAGYYNDGAIRIAVNGGSISSNSDGVRARFAWEDSRNGAIDVTVAEGATVAGAAAGVYVANAGMGSDDILMQRVTVHGTVTGGTDSAVHLSGGGHLTVGRTGKVHAGSSGLAVLVNDPGPATLVVHGEIRGGAGAPAAVHLTGGGTVLVSPTGSVQANGAALAIRGDEATTVTVQTASTIASLNRVTALAAIRDRVSDGSSGPVGARVEVRLQELDDRGATGHSRTIPVLAGPDGATRYDVSSFPEPPPPPAGSREPSEPSDEPSGPAGPSGRTPDMRTVFGCADTNDGRCGLYEALPSALASMNALPGYDERLSAARSANGGWARVEGATGEWKAESATQTKNNVNVAYDLRRHGVRAGVDIVAGERLRVGVSAHRLRSNAKMERVGEIELAGSGAGLNATLTGDGFYADLQAAVTWFEADLTSAMRGALTRGAEGTGYAAALEAGRRIDVSDAVAVVPRAGLSWSDASLDVFTDSVGSGARVSVDEARSLTGRVGARVEAAPEGMDGVRLFGSLDVSQLLSQGAEARVSDTALKTASEETGFRAGVGAYATLADNVSLRAAAHYEASGGDNSSFGGALSLALRF